MNPAAPAHYWVAVALSVDLPVGGACVLAIADVFLIDLRIKPARDATQTQKDFFGAR